MATSICQPLSRFIERLLRRSELTRKERNAILDLKGRTLQFQANRTIVAQGREVDHVCLIANGLAARYDQVRCGLRQSVALYLPGEMCDLHSAPSPVTGWGIQALTTTTIFHIAHADLRDLASAYPAIATAFWRDTVADASVLAKWLVNLGRKDSRSRAAHLLCELGIRMEAAGIGTRTSFPLQLTQDHLADFLGLTPVHTNRVLRGLREEGLAEMKHRHVRILD